MKRRYFKESAMGHVYQRTWDRGVVFYSDVDFVNFFTLICVAAQKYGVRIVAICLMHDHFHMIVESESCQNISAFLQYCTALHAREINHDTENSGKFWQKSYGMAMKSGEKKKRTALAYVCNNGVEKHLAERTEGYRWNFLAYFLSDTPFSSDLSAASPTDVLVLKQSPALKKLKASARTSHKLGLPITRTMLLYAKRHLDHGEWNLLCDYVISLYNVIDYETAISYYGDYQTMLVAMNANTGSEYDIREEQNPYSDTGYEAICRFLCESGLLDGTSISGTFRLDPRSILRLSVEDRRKIAAVMIARQVAPEYLVRKYLHLVME